MSPLLKKIYESIICYEEDVIQMDKRISMDIELCMSNHKNSLSDSEQKLFKEVLYQTALTSQQEGFQMGMRYMLKLFMVLLSEEDVYKP